MTSTSTSFEELEQDVKALALSLTHSLTIMNVTFDTLNSLIGMLEENASDDQRTRMGEITKEHTALVENLNKQFDQVCMEAGV